MDQLISSIPIVQVVGFKNCGKTSIIENVVSSLGKKGIGVGVIKHHGHGGSPDSIDQEGTDTHRFQQAGAVVSSVEGEGIVQLQMHIGINNPLPLLISVYQQLNSVDLIIVEGYKDAPYPKVIVYKTASEMSELLELSNVIGLIGQSMSGNCGFSVPEFSFQKPEAYIRFFEEYIRRS
ncbi:molybdopterin-guanine dinucleotide biosynthesis protein B [Pseudalkalibacillus decolorationis]|uniref:molybdopterin-guanine dinucleotide biosynthesis protein B n=1 Tax=Pseudalkalibacillus decolorationis TaxID=163879 RepID=UPI002147E21B|nr:molybdopterin-guanine dinucleotide biosynthesis protein B [Pseudalkalibacillus decolorationis]